MYSLYQTNHITGTGVAIIIVSSGKQNQIRFAEYYVLLPHMQPCKVMSQPYSVKPSEHDLSHEELCGHIRDNAKNRLQVQVDEQCLKTGSTLPPLVTLNETDDAALHGLRLAGICEDQLKMIATQTRCLELKTAIRKLDQLPVVSTTTLPWRC
jgi:hypothetical protein